MVAGSIIPPVGDLSPVVCHQPLFSSKPFNELPRGCIYSILDVMTGLNVTALTLQ
jgi:hypothetical protein